MEVGHDRARSSTSAPRVGESVAGTFRRLLAWMIDLLAVTALVFVVVSLIDAAIGPTVEIRPDAATLPATVSVDRARLIFDRLGAGAREAQTLDRGNPGPDLLGEQDLGLGRRGERRATADLGLDGVDDGRVRVTEDQRGVVAEEIAIAVAVDVAEPQTAARLDVRRVRSRVDRRPRRAARQRARRALEQLS